ncbi:hypothetical protein AVEN_208433-2 [Araneus ventricosus]|uniref:Uncharacterized protein n=1 Tax=Araneus ventricosus TaxID=182803 RepID=A0A4Y2EEG5_ARAVE|nr:hypothetical protein AVEN_208433-2 [Araneus ventricosus]
MSKKYSEKDDCNAVSEKKLNREKGAIKGTLSRIETFTSEKTVSKDTNITELQVKLKKLEQLQTQLDKISEEYCEIETSEKFETIQQDIEQINERIEETKVGLKILLSSLKVNENTNTILNDNGKAKIRLPEIPLPEFSGKIAEFANFKNQFTNLISNNDQLNDSQKLYYLHASLKGEAKLLESSSDNFQSLFKALSDRYENLCQLIDSHVLEIINYDKIHSESAKGLRALMDCVNKNFRALKVLKYEQNKLSDPDEIRTASQALNSGEGEEVKSNQSTAEGQTEVSVLTFANKSVVLNTLFIYAKTADGCRVKLRGLLDNASTLCIIREDVARKLGIKLKSINQGITGINGAMQSVKYSAKTEVSNHDYTFSRIVQCSVLSKITDVIPESKLNISELNIPSSIELADSSFHTPGQIDILVGSELFFEILKPEQHRVQDGNVILQNFVI